MFRENVLTQDDILDRIATTMVPVAVDRWKAEDPRTEEAKFLQPFLKKHPEQGSPCIYSPAGKVLGSFHGFGDMAGKTRVLIENSLRSFGPVELREVDAPDTHPFRGKGFMSDGSVSLAEYIRPTAESLAHMHTKSPVISSVTLTKEEFASLGPRQIVVGEKWTLPNRVAKKFSRVTSSLCYQHAPQPDWVTSVRIRGEVCVIEGGMAQLAYDGQIASEHRVAGQIVSAQQTRLSGEGTYDVNTKSMGRVVLVGSGNLRWPEDPEKLVSFDVLVEWTQ